MMILSKTSSIGPKIVLIIQDDLGYLKTFYEDSSGRLACSARKTEVRS